MFLCFFVFFLFFFFLFSSPEPKAPGVGAYRIGSFPSLSVVCHLLFGITTFK